MESMAKFFDSINKLLGIKDAGELVFHPAFIGLCLVLFIYSLIKGWKGFYLSIAGILGGGVIFKYLYPAESSDLFQLVKFLGAMGVLGLILVYLGFVRN